MTTNNKRIEAEIAAEVKRIEAWREAELALPFRWSAAKGGEIRSLAEYQTRKRLQVEDARLAALLDAALAALPRLLPAYTDEQRTAYTNLKAAIAPYEEKP